MSESTKAQRTRERLRSAALELFADRGYDSTGVAQIAAAAGVSEMTFFRYFPSKESVLLEDPYDPVMAAAIADQPRDAPPLLRAIRGIRSTWRSMPSSEVDDVRLRVRIIAQSPALRSGLVRTSGATERAIADALGGDGFVARVAAAAVMAALNSAVLEWSMSDESELGTMIDDALDVLAAHHG